MPRPRSYDETDLLNSAMQMFWARGYEQTSISDLVAETGVNRASLYTAYPDKRALFIASVQHYLENVTQQNLALLNGTEPAAEAIQKFFHTVATSPARKIGNGCLVTNSAVEFSDTDPEISALIRQAFKKVEQTLTKRLKEAQAARQLPKSVDPTAYARHLVVLLQGLRVMGRAGTSRAVMRDAVESALAPLKA